MREYRRARSTNRAGEPSEPFFRGTGQGLYAPDLRPWRFQARRRRERVAVPTSTDDNNAWERQGRKDGAYPPLAHAPREPRRNERSLGNLLPRPSGWSPRRRSYLSFHDCAAWSFPSGQASSRYGLPVFSSSASPCRSLQPLRPGQPAARVGPATGSGRRPCVASTLCWLAGMGEINCFRSKAKSMAFRHAFCFGSGSYLSFHAVASTVFSAYKGLTSVFGMGTGGSP